MSVIYVCMNDFFIFLFQSNVYETSELLLLNLILGEMVWEDAGLGYKFNFYVRIHRITGSVHGNFMDPFLSGILFLGIRCQLRILRRNIFAKSNTEMLVVIFLY